MTEVDAEVRYSPDHLWLRREGARVTIGVTEKISRILTWVNAVALPTPGTRFANGAEFAEIESQKADIALPAPAALEVVAVNEALQVDPMLVRMDPRGEGWLVRGRLDDGEWERLLGAAAYDELLRASV
jgi:glycine cleavage system H protein